MKLANSLQKHPYISQWLKFNSDLKLEIKLTYQEIFNGVDKKIKIR